jgi:CBS domain-containing protein
MATRKASLAEPTPDLVAPEEVWVGRSDLPYNVRVSDVMSRRPISLGTEASLFDALVVLRTNRITGVPVVTPDGTVVGVVSERDLVRVLGLPWSTPGAEGMMDLLMAELAGKADPKIPELRARLEESKVGEVMSRPPLTVRGEAPLELAMEVMTDHEVHRLPVVEQGRLVGLLTTHDLLRSVLRPPRRP